MTDKITKDREYARRGLPNRKVEFIVGKTCVVYMDENDRAVEVMLDGMWCSSGDSAYDLIPYVAPPPRFTLTEDGCGVLDSERPGMVFDGETKSRANSIVECLRRGVYRPEEYDWQPIPQPEPRFTLTEDQCGILDSEQPGMVAAHSACRVSAKENLRLLNSGVFTAASFHWEPIPQPHRKVPHTRETWPDDAWIRHQDDDTEAVRPTGVDDRGVTITTYQFDEKKPPTVEHLSWRVLFDNYLLGTSHKKSATWHRCETEERV